MGQKPQPRWAAAGQRPARLPYCPSDKQPRQKQGISCPAPAGYAGPGVPSITFPYPLATLSLPDTTSSGTALWYGLPGPGPTYIGDSFTFIAGIAGGNLSQTFTG